MEKYIKKLISKSRKQITILFTDIEDSTKLWEAKGDVQARLILDQHNRLIFPVIHKFRGKIIKTIGDSVMASFKSPQNAIRASISIQQAIAHQAKIDRKFKLKIRIGLHTGKAIVEKSDVFGDVVNVAARVESFGKGGDITVSARTANLVKHKEFLLTKKTSFTPKGKKNSITVYRSDWQKLPSLINDINFNSTLPILSRNKMELFVYSLASVGILYFIFHYYLRYLIADQKLAFILNFNPQQFITDSPVLFTLFVVAVIALGTLIYFLTILPFFVVKLLKGGFGFALVFLIAHFAINNFNIKMIKNFETNILSSKHLFVEVIEKNTTVHKKPNTHSTVIIRKNTGDLLLLTDIQKNKKITWNKVLIADNQYGWIPRILPARMGVPEKRHTITYKFYLKWKHAYALILGIFGFIWGYFNFKIRPS